METRWRLLSETKFPGLLMSSGMHEVLKETTEHLIFKYADSATALWANLFPELTAFHHSLFK